MEKIRETIEINHQDEPLAIPLPPVPKRSTTRRTWRRLPCIFHARRDVGERLGIRNEQRKKRSMGNSESLVTVACRPPPAFFSLARRHDACYVASTFWPSRRPPAPVPVGVGAALRRLMRNGPLRRVAPTRSGMYGRASKRARPNSASTCSGVSPTPI